MFREYFVLLFLAHIIGDFYAQNNYIAEKKEQHLSCLFLHGLLYWAIILLVSLPVLSWQVFFYGCIAAALHLLIDFGKRIVCAAINKRQILSPRHDRNIFFIDQLLHVVSISLVAYVFVKQGNGLVLHEGFADFLKTLGLRALNIVSYLAVFLAIHKPINIAIAKILLLYKSDDYADETDDKKAGRFIGTLERAIIVIFISLSQYAAIGLVLTAKSIARYDKISKDPTFAEYYLIGTLLSTLAAIGAAFIL